MGRFVFAAVAVFFAFFLGLCPVSAEQDDEAARARLGSIRSEIAAIKYNYEQETQKANGECDDKLAAAKGEFHKVRAKHMEERDNRIAGLKSAYKEKAGPLLAEEKVLLQSVTPEKTNFSAKDKSR